MTITHKAFKRTIGMVNQQFHNIKPPNAVIDLSTVVCVKAAVTAAKTFELFLLEKGISIQNIYLLVVCELTSQQAATSILH